MSEHPFAAVLEAAAAGSFPPADGAVEVLTPDPSGWWAVVAFTGHAYVLADVDPDELRAAGADGYGGALHPPALSLIAGPGGTIGSVDAVLVALAEPGPVLPRRDDLDDHPRAQRARHHRRDVEVYADDDGLVVLGRGLVGRRELAVELFDPAAAGGAGHGRRLIRAGLAALAPGERCWAQVSPGNAASLRAFLACGFVPIGSEVILQPAPRSSTVDRRAGDLSSLRPRGRGALLRSLYGMPGGAATGVPARGPRRRGRRVRAEGERHAQRRGDHGRLVDSGSARSQAAPLTSRARRRRLTAALAHLPLGVPDHREPVRLPPVPCRRRGRGAIGSASPLQGGGCGFESRRLHMNERVFERLNQRCGLCGHRCPAVVGESNASTDSALHQ